MAELDARVDVGGAARRHTGPAAIRIQHHWNLVSNITGTATRGASVDGHYDLTPKEAPCVTGPTRKTTIAQFWSAGESWRWILARPGRQRRTAVI